LIRITATVVHTGARRASDAFCATRPERRTADSGSHQTILVTPLAEISLILVIYSKK
jgi:hypothetical protein